MHGTLRRILSLYKPYAKMLYLALALEVMAIVTRLILPRLTATVVNDVITDGHYELLTGLCIAIVALTALRSLCNYVRGMIFQTEAQNVAYSIRTELYDHLQQMPWEFYDKNRVGEVMSRMTGDLNNIRNFLCNTTFSVFTNSLCFVGSLIFTCGLYLMAILLFNRAERTFIDTI